MNPSRRRSRSIVAVAALSVAAVLVPQGPARAQTFEYPSAVPPCNTTLQDCIDGVGDGDRIRIVTDGPIDENLRIEKSLTLFGDPGVRPVIGGGPDTRIIRIESPGPSSELNVTIRRLRLRNAAFQTALFDGSGHRVVIERTSVVLGGESSGGRGIDYDTRVESSLLLRNNTFTVDGYGVYLWLIPGADQRAEATVESNLIKSFHSQHGASGVTVDARGDGTAVANLYSNTIHRMAGCNCGGADGIETYALNNVKSIVNIVGNTIDKTLEQSAGIAVTDYNSDARLRVAIFNNLITRGEQEPIYLPTPASDKIKIPNGYNDFFANGARAQFGGYSKGPRTLTLNPRYRDPSEKNFRLSAGSPLIDKGSTCTSGGLSRRDEDFRSRLRGAAVDIGAYEFGAGAVAKGIALTGTATGELLTGTQGSDIICGLGGPDGIDAKGGKDFTFGGPGNDTIDGGRKPDRVFGAKGKDRLFGSGGGDVIVAEDGVKGNDKVRGGPGRDTCSADARDDVRGC